MGIEAPCVTMTDVAGISGWGLSTPITRTSSLPRAHTDTSFLEMFTVAREMSLRGLKSGHGLYVTAVTDLALKATHLTTSILNQPF